MSRCNRNAKCTCLIHLDGLQRPEMFPLVREEMLSSMLTLSLAWKMALVTIVATRKKHRIWPRETTAQEEEGWVCLSVCKQYHTIVVGLATPCLALCQVLHANVTRRQRYKVQSGRFGKNAVLQNTTHSVRHLPLLKQ